MRVVLHPLGIDQLEITIRDPDITCGPVIFHRNTDRKKLVGIIGVLPIMYKRDGYLKIIVPHRAVKGKSSNHLGLIYGIC